MTPSPCIWLGTTYPCNPPHYGLWVWVNLHFFTMFIYKHCFLPMLLVFAMKWCTKIPCPLPHNHYCCLLPSTAHLYMPHLFTHCLPTIICAMLMCIVFSFFFFVFFLIFVICYISLWLHFGLFVYIFLLSFKPCLVYDRLLIFSFFHCHFFGLSIVNENHCPCGR